MTEEQMKRLKQLIPVEGNKDSSKHVMSVAAQHWLDQQKKKMNENKGYIPPGFHVTNGHSAIDSILALNDLKNMNWKSLSDSLLAAAKDTSNYRVSNEGYYGNFGKDEVADIMYQILSGKGSAEYDNPTTAFMNPEIGYPYGNPRGDFPTRIFPEDQREVTSRPANIRNLINILHGSSMPP